MSIPSKQTKKWWFMKQASSINSVNIAKYVHYQTMNEYYRMYMQLLIGIRDFLNTNSQSHERKRAESLHDYICQKFLDDIIEDLSGEECNDINVYIFLFG